MARASFDGRAAIIGAGQTPFKKDLGVSEMCVAMHAIQSAVADAGLTMRDIDGIVRYDMDTNSETALATMPTRRP
jgi:acetyl-CoA acetyltransferase